MAAQDVARTYLQLHTIVLGATQQVAKLHTRLHQVEMRADEVNLVIRWYGSAR